MDLAIRPETQDLGFIEELCIALAHRWEPERLFMIFTAYFDESDTHGPAPNVVMAAFLGSARQWKLFERRLRNLQIKYGFTIFHAKEFKGRDGEFTGWSNKKAASFINDLVTLIRDELAAGLTITLPYEQYQTEYRKSPTPKKMRLDSQYGVCFRACLVDKI